jgi:hypothetical protein
MKKYIFHTDPAHGWLAVKRKELEELGLLDKISPYSYQRGETVYLEEDADMALFHNAKGFTDNSYYETKFSKGDRASPIRSYASYRPEVRKYEPGLQLTYGSRQFTLREPLKSGAWRVECEGHAYRMSPRQLAESELMPSQ